MVNQTAYVALGANLGEPAKTVLRAVERMDAMLPGVRVAARSRVWHTAPHELEELEYPLPECFRLKERAEGLARTAAPWYANMVVRLECNASVTLEALFEALMALEAKLGRSRLFEKRYGPRVIDIDLLLFGYAVRETARLTLPHPRMMQRNFVVGPLREVVASGQGLFAALKEKEASPINLLV